MKNVIAVIVTHNRYQSLVNCIEAVRSQTIKPNHILVVNNGSSDYTSVWLDQQEDIIHLYQENTGSSGGFHKGISWSYQNGYKWIWCMEDDSYPQENALEKLMIHGLNDKSLVSSRIVNNSYNQMTNTNSFNGTLIHHSIIAKAGLPKFNMFCKGAESEYYYRITRKCGFSSKTIYESVHFHSNSPADYQSEWDIQSSWKLYFEIRNQFEVYQSKYNNRLFAFFYYLQYVYRLLRLIFNTQKEEKINKAFLIINAMTAGLMGDFNATNFSVIQKIKRRNRNSFIENFLFPIRSFILQHFVPSFSEIQKTA